jgi:hypothetical protein
MEVYRLLRKKWTEHPTQYSEDRECRHHDCLSEHGDQSHLRMTVLILWGTEAEALGQSTWRPCNTAWNQNMRSYCKAFCEELRDKIFYVSF